MSATSPSKLGIRPPLRIRGGVAEHVEEDGLGEGVELGEGGAALGPQRVRFVQDLRNPPLLGEGWQRDTEPGEEVRRGTRRCPRCPSFGISPWRADASPVAESAPSSARQLGRVCGLTT